MSSVDPSLIFNWVTKWPLFRFFFHETILFTMMARVLIEEERRRFGNYERMKCMTMMMFLDSFSLRLQPIELFMICSPIFGTR